MPVDLAAIADRLEAAGREAEGRGEAQSALAFYREALALRAALEPGAARALLLSESSANLQAVTGAQLQRRGKAIARAKAAKSDDPLWAAIVTSKWGSQERYARERLKVSPGSLSAYRSGATPCPRAVANMVLKDFDIGPEYWKGGVVE